MLDNVESDWSHALPFVGPPIFLHFKLVVCGELMLVFWRVSVEFALLRGICCHPNGEVFSTFPQASEQASNNANQPKTNKPKQAKEPASKQASRQTSRQAGKQASQQANKPASKQASKQAGKQESKQEAGKQASEQASKQASRRASEQASKQASRQAGRQASNHPWAIQTYPTAIFSRPEDNLKPTFSQLKKTVKPANKAEP